MNNDYPPLSGPLRCLWAGANALGILLYLTLAAGDWAAQAEMDQVLGSQGNFDPAIALSWALTQLPILVVFLVVNSATLLVLLFWRTSRQRRASAAWLYGAFFLAWLVVLMIDRIHR